MFFFNICLYINIFNMFVTGKYRPLSGWLWWCYTAIRTTTTRSFCETKTSSRLGDISTLFDALRDDLFLNPWTYRICFKINTFIHFPFGKCEPQRHTWVSFTMLNINSATVSDPNLFLKPLQCFAVLWQIDFIALIENGIWWRKGFFTKNCVSTGIQEFYIS